MTAHSSTDSLLSENRKLRTRLAEAEETLSAIRGGEIDALVVSGAEGEQIYTLKGADQTYRILVETMNEGALTLSAEGTILYCNTRFSEMLGSDIENIMGRSIYEFINAPEREDFREFLAQGIVDRAKGEAVLGIAHGKSLPVLLSSRSLPFEGRSLLCMVVTDLTEQKRAEERLRGYSAELEQKNKGLQEFSYVASHDLQEPLRKIHAFADLLVGACGGAVDEKGQDYLRRMRNSVKRMQALIEGLLAYSRISTRASAFSRVDLKEIAGEALSNLEVLLKEKGGRVDIGPLPAIEAEPHQMLQLFQNLIGNALKFSRDEQPPEVVVRAESSEEISPEGKKESFCKIWVQDTGIGFDEKYLDRMFAPFQRLHGRGKYGGTGIGLAICKRVVEYHRGELTAKNRPEGGSVFIVKLPVEQDRDPE